MASYKIDTSYSVTVTLSLTSGFVQNASCTCIASAMGRCSHIAAVIFGLLDYNQKYGYEPAACTSKNVNGMSGGKDPKKITDAKYLGIKKKKNDDLITFDPRPQL
jgi:hypothetical protein